MLIYTSHVISRRFSNLLHTVKYLKFSKGRFFPFLQKFSGSIKFSSDSSNQNEILTNESQDEEYIFNKDPLCETITNLYRHPSSGHNLFLIQPRVKFSEAQERATLKLNEAIALVQTLKGWQVVEKCIMSTRNTSAKVLFGKGNMELLRSKIKSNSLITGVFIGIDMLSALQNATLEKYFGVQVFDRYQIVLRIFHNHACTKEAKLQIALAEIPYLRVKLAAYSHTQDMSTFGEIKHAGGTGEVYMETRKRLLFERELKLKRAIEKLDKQREYLRTKTNRQSFPIIAVVGYTNCGKTSLIRSLTKDLNLIPENKLFATLDVTLHAGFLPSSQKVLYIDTVGFISDVPTALIQSFKSTLQDALFADIIIHVRDISHPDTVQQKEVVMKTLEELKLPQKLLDSIIEIGNKMDLMDSNHVAEEENLMLISATEGTNLSALMEKIEDTILSNVGYSTQLFRVTNGGEDYRWLLKHAAIREARADERDMNFLIVEVIISDSLLSKFKHDYGDLTISVEEALARLSLDKS